MAWVIWAHILICLSLQNAQSTDTDFPQSVCEVYQNDGDYIIGAIFKPYISETCAGKLSHQVSFIEAMAYAIDSINNQSQLLPGVKLGYEIRNACDDGEVTIWTLMTMTTSFGRYEYTATCPEQERTNSGKVIGIIGTGRSATSIIAAKIGRVVTVPIISYYATSDELSDSKRFPFFFRTVPPDRYQVEMIIDMLRHFNWKYVALFHSLDSYGVYGARQVVRLAEMYDICIAMNVPVTIPTSEREIQDIAQKLSEHNKVNVIVSFVVWHGAFAILKALRLLDTPRKFTFIGSDANWDDVPLSDFSDMFHGGITFQFIGHLPNNVPEPFPRYFRELQQTKKSGSRWYQKKLDEIRGTTNCTSSCATPVHWNVQQVINAVYAIVYALNETLQEMPRQTGSTNAPVNGWLLRQKLLEVSIPCAVDQYFHFDENGEVAGRYYIKNWQKKNGLYKPVADIGTWDSRREPHLNLEEEQIQWNTDDHKAPISLCVEKCKPGYIEVPLEKKCCKGCHKCNDYEITVKENSAAKCRNCSVTEWPNENFTSCVAIEPSFLSSHSHPEFTQLIVGAGAGLLLIVLASIGLCYYSEHPVIKASSRELCSINLVGLASLCVTVMLNLLRPTQTVCMVIEIMTSTSFCISFAPILLKVNRIWRIFSMRPDKEVPFISPRSQCVIAFCIIGIEVLLEIISIVFAPSVPALLIPPQRQPYLEIYCRFGYGFIAPCAYNAFIIVGSCYCAFKARKVPDNFNESKFIAVSVYSTLIICLAAVPVYTTAVSVAQKIGSLIVPLLVNTYLTLCCLYFPKIYAIHFKKPQDRARSALSSSAASSQNRLDQVSMTPVTSSLPDSH